MLLLIGLGPKEAILSEGGYGERCSFGDGSYGDGRVEDDLTMLVDKPNLNGGVERMSHAQRIIDRYMYGL